MLATIFNAPFDPVVQQLKKNSGQDLPHLVTGLDDSARAVLLAQLYQEQPQQMIVVEPVATHLSQLCEDLQQLLPNVKVLEFPVEEALALEYSYASFDSLAQRLECLVALLNQEACIIICSPAALRKQLNPPEQWQQQVQTLELGQEMDRQQLERQLHNFGYHHQPMVQSPGEYSIRGSIVDFYPLNQPHPIRLDFFDTELDSIRLFDAQTQESIENRDRVVLAPATDLLFTLEEQQALLPKLETKLEQVTQRMQDQELAQQIKRAMVDQLAQLKAGQPLKYAPAFFRFNQSKPASLLDYAQPSACLVLMEYGKIVAQEHQLAQEDQYWLEQEIVKGTILPNVAVHHNCIELIRQSDLPKLHFSVMHRGLGNLTFAAVHAFQYRSMNPFFNQMPLVKTEVDHWIKQGYTIQVLASSAKQAQKTQARFEEYGMMGYLVEQATDIMKGRINISQLTLTNGFELPLAKWVVLTERELFNQLKKRHVRPQNLSNAERIKSYNELTVGDYVVHVNHGIGLYTGMDTLEINGIHKDLLAIEYQNKARVLIPVDQIHLLQKYVSSESRTPKINKLGGTDWVKTKQKVAAKVEDIADELIALYAQREQEQGYAFGPDTPEQAEFEQAFAYVETPDQLRSTQEIKADMEKIRPMDRLLVGDVGYGKTEVAMRAIFKAVMDGKQVAFLVPTTILAQQHYNSLVQRFADYPFEIGLLSRFASKTSQQETLKGLASGQCAIVVGTHRLLSKDVHFLDLGLLIVDEEQRFGVKHKERLKQLKAQVDVLTLTATPIPRTLHMSMIGVRDLSLIETPPNNRFPVQTYVMERNDGAIKTAIEREMARGGQVFYLYNRVATIDQRALEIHDLVPDARVAVAHGQMSEAELETVLIDFIQGAYDVLVTTTIIETGVDIPNANTLFIEDADRMGLSTLYQLRGRVGRTHRVAYAYLLYEPFKQLSEVSEKRLQAIKEFTELGSGFKIAMRDLSIRGAGNLLGKQQSGFIDSVGFDMYSQMLKEAVDLKRGKKSPVGNVASSDLEIDLAIDAYLPSDYIEDGRQKIAIYKSIQQLDSEEAYRQLQDQLIDRFGEFPDQVADLLEVGLIRYFGSKAGMTQIKQQNPWLIISFNSVASKALMGPKIFEAMQDIPLKAEVQMDQDNLQVRFLIQGKKSYQWLSALHKLAQRAAQLVEKGQAVE
ncbi:transcription-repair coupling factor [Vaginisenegalia massiliensis]|uniref:transcription-repair coupling factor n=1 Tax=Vaginisenegalia massiliensis TaxID=2058294 RepID=UPI000F548591|nr:transcription-repair coupling factor [Vaginisenegalia massiliensis]